MPRKNIAPMRVPEDPESVFWDFPIPLNPPNIVPTIDSNGQQSYRPPQRGLRLSIVEIPTFCIIRARLAIACVN